MKKNDTLNQAEQALYQTLVALSQRYPVLNAWLAALPAWLAEISDKQRYANAPYYRSLVEKLPMLSMGESVLNASEVGAVVDFSADEYQKTTALLQGLSPWRKGGFCFGSGARQIHIDSEWRSDFKWDRIAPFVDLVGKRVLDVGGGSGYHGWRMAGAGADWALVLDPSPLFYYQFMAVRHFLPMLSNRFGQYPVHFLPVALDSLPASALFHVVFCMGVLYHRPSPFDCLWQLKQQLAAGGTLVLETLVVDGDERTVLVPQNRYAMMNNVYFLPSAAALKLWLEKAGFVAVRCVDVTTTTTDEQRATAWMTYQSLSDFLHKDDSSKTVEGYERPKRAIFLATKR